MNIAIIDCGSSAVCKISEVVIELGSQNEVILMKDLCDDSGVCKYNFDAYDGIIISGSPITLSLENRDKYLKMFPFIKLMKKPIFGICFGHQVIAHTFGASYSNGDFIDGLHPVNLLIENHLFHGTEDRIFYQNHEQQVGVPKDFTLMADSETCKNEAMEHKSDMIHSVQFHPERSGEEGKIIIQNFLNLCA